MSRRSLAFGICFLLICSAFIPVSLGLNVKVSKMEQPSIYGGGKTLYVGGSGGDNYTKIQDAIDNASEGDTVFVFDDNSPYNENVIVNKSINLIGEIRNTTIIEGHENDDIVHILADGVNISGFTIQNRDDREHFSTGIYIKSGDNKIHNCIIKNSSGIDIGEYSSNNIIQDNHIINNGGGIQIDGYKSCNNNLIIGNLIAHNGAWGIGDFDRDGVVTATWNVIADNGKFSQFGAGLFKWGKYGVYHHNDFLFNRKNADPDFGENTWDDGFEGNYWDDWEENEGYPEVYYINQWNIDRHPNVTPYMDSFIVALPSPYYVKTNEIIEFIADINVDPYSVSWFWDFGDGNISDEMYPSHSYSKSGIYFISVTVTDYLGKSDTSITKAYIGSPPEKPIIIGPTKGVPGIRYNYTFITIDPDGDDIYLTYWWGKDFWFTRGPYASGEEVKLSHIWYEKGKYEITAYARDTIGLESDWAKYTVTMPRNRATYNSLFLQLVELFPILKEVILRLIR